MSLEQQLDHYLQLRRSMGYDLRTSERVLRSFLDFAHRQGALVVSPNLFADWQATFGSAARQTWARRFGIVRLFTQWLHGIDPRHEILPKGLIPFRRLRPRPYIYSDEQVRQIIAAAAELPSIYGLRALTCSTLFGLIATTGLRISEALSLDVDDVDFVSAVLTIRHGKGDKERLIPVHASVASRLKAYGNERDRILGMTPRCFFATSQGSRLGDCTARYNFALVCQRVGIRATQKYGRHGRGPRIHDLRHSFAVSTFLDWYRTGKDPARELIKLTSYLGHENPDHTYWYVEAVPELLELASRRVEDSQTWEVCQ